MLMPMAFVTMWTIASANWTNAECAMVQVPPGIVGAKHCHPETVTAMATNWMQ